MKTEFSASRNGFRSRAMRGVCAGLRFEGNGHVECHTAANVYRVSRFLSLHLRYLETYRPDGVLCSIELPGFEGGSLKGLFFCSSKFQDGGA